MLYSIEGIIDGEPEDLKIIAENYFEKFCDFDADDNKLRYNTGFIFPAVNLRLYPLQEEIYILKGIIALITGKSPQLGFEKLHSINECGKTSASLIWSQHICPSRPALAGLTDQKIDATQIYLKALEDLDLRWVLLLLSQRNNNTIFAPLGWSPLYTIYEFIGSRLTPVSKKKKIEDVISSVLGIDKAHIKRFTGLANNTRNPYEGVRHGDDEPSEDYLNEKWSPDAIEWGLKFIREIAIKWIKHKHEIEIIPPKADINKYTDTSDTTEEQIKSFRSSAEAYEEIYLK